MSEPTSTRRCARWGSSATSSRGGNGLRRLRWRRWAAAACLLAFGLALAGHARAGDDVDATTLYDRAEEALAAGHPARAAAELEKAARAGATAAFAADALFSAARIYEQRLADVGRARELYRQIEREFPDSRVALAASRRARAIGQLTETPDDAEALAAWKHTLHSYPSAGRRASVSRAEAILLAHPHWSGRVDILVWLATQRQELGELHRAENDLSKALAAARDPAERFDVQRRRVTLSMLRGRPHEAAMRADQLDPGADPARIAVAHDLRAMLGRSRVRRGAYAASGVVLLACVLGLLLSLALATRSPRRAARALWPPPFEVLFAVPFSVLLVAMALTSFADMGPAVTLISAGGIGFTWLSGATLRASSRSRARTLLHIVLVTAGVAAVIYIAVDRSQLIDQILETVRFGPD